MSDNVYGLTLLVWTLVPFPKDCLHSLFWNDHLKTNTLAIVYSIWCIPKFGVKQFNWIWDQSTSICPCHYDTMTYWLLIWSLLCLIKQLRDSELSNVSIPPASFTIKYLNIHFLLKSHKISISKLCFFFQINNMFSKTKAACSFILQLLLGSWGSLTGSLSSLNSIHSTWYTYNS